MRALVLAAALAVGLLFPPAAQARPTLSPTSLDPVITAAEYWRLDDLCRGESDPTIYEPACRRRDRAIQQLGIQMIKRFHTAWVRGDHATIRRMLKTNSYLAYFRGRGAITPPDCTYDERETSFYCWVKPREGNWFGMSVEVTRYQRPLIPLWQITGAAPDV